MTDTIQETCLKHDWRRGFSSGQGCPKCKDDEIERVTRVQAGNAREIERLRVKLAEKDKRIEELEEYYNRYPPDFIEKLQQEIDEWKCGMRHIITTEQIDKAWQGRNIAYDSSTTPAEIIEDALADLDIVACPKCGGMKRAYKNTHSVGPVCEECDCPNNGWVIKKGGSVG